MKSRKILVFVLALVMSIVIPLQVSASSAFKDVDSAHWSSKDIDQLFKRGVVVGTGNGEFKPNKNVTRAEAAIMITRALDLEVSNADNLNYQDLKKEHFAYNHIAAVTKANIMTGYNGKFNPDKPLTRAEMATVISKSFDLTGGENVHFSDVNKEHWGYKAIAALYAAGIAKGYDDGSFKPNKNISRSEFAALLSRSLVGYESDLAALLKEVYNNEATIESFAFTSDFQLGINLPDNVSNEIPDLAILAEVLKDIKVNIDGVYQLNPMKMEMDVQVELGGSLNMTIDLPMIITEEKFLIKIPEIPQLPLPEEMVGKFIEFDMTDLQGLNGVTTPIGPTQMTLETELIQALNELVIDNFLSGFFQYVDHDEIDIPDTIDVKEVVKFEITNDDLKRFMLIAIEDFFPAFLDLMTDPDYAAAFGFTEADLEMMKTLREEMQTIQPDMIASLDEMLNIISINEFESYIVISEDHYIPYSTTVIDIELTVDNDVLGLTLYSIDEKSKINETPTFKYDNLKDSDIISFMDLLNIDFAS